jgi:ferredoxin-like protein FixX
MAELKFSQKDIEVLQEAAREARDAAVKRAQEVIREKGIVIGIPADLKNFAPRGEKVGNDSCFACFACLILGAASLAIAWTSA